LIAGEGQFPLLLSEAARKQGVRVFAVAHEGGTLDRIEQSADHVLWVKLGQFERIISYFKEHELKEAVMAGAITKTDIFGRIEPDERALAIAARLGSLNDDSFLREVAIEFEKEGITIQPSTIYTPELQAPPGILTKRSPTAEEEMDIAFGWHMAKAIGEHDIGQCVVVRHRTVLAVEAIEGTDETIRRGCRLAKKTGAVVVKVIKPNQDIRFDMPSVGLNTIKVMEESGASALAIETGKTLVFNRAEMIAAADRAGIAVIAREDE